jgi:hypothetical protein
LAERNHTLVRKELRAQSVIEPSGVFASRCEEHFPCASTESTHRWKLLLSSVMRKLSGSRTWTNDGNADAPDLAAQLGLQHLSGLAIEGLS